jgi:hypothetical protein
MRLPHLSIVAPLLTASLVAAIAGCSGADTSGGGGSEARRSDSKSSPPDEDGCGGPIDIHCTTNDQCPEGSTCEYFVAEECNATGMCVASAAGAATCGAITTVEACGCDGKDVTWQGGCGGIPEGSAPFPVAHIGSCADGG